MCECRYLELRTSKARETIPPPTDELYRLVRRVKQEAARRVFMGKGAQDDVQWAEVRGAPDLSGLLMLESNTYQRASHYNDSRSSSLTSSEEVGLDSGGSGIHAPNLNFTCNAAQTSQPVVELPTFMLCDNCNMPGWRKNNQDTSLCDTCKEYFDCHGVMRPLTMTRDMHEDAGEQGDIIKDAQHVEDSIHNQPQQRYGNESEYHGADKELLQDLDEASDTGSLFSIFSQVSKGSSQTSAASSAHLDLFDACLEAFAGHERFSRLCGIASEEIPSD